MSFIILIISIGKPPSFNEQCSILNARQPSIDYQVSLACSILYLQLALYSIVYHSQSVYLSIQQLQGQFSHQTFSLFPPPPPPPSAPLTNNGNVIPSRRKGGRKRIVCSIGEQQKIIFPRIDTEKVYLPSTMANNKSACFQSIEMAMKFNSKI